MKNISPLAGLKPKSEDLVTEDRMRRLYYHPDGELQSIKNGTSGHRGETGRGFSDRHVAAITQALINIRQERKSFGPDPVPAWAKERPLGPIIIGKDVRFTSDFAQNTAIEVFAGNGVPVIIHKGNRATPTPVISHTILAANRNGNSEGIIITASHNPPAEAGYKSNGLNGGPNTRTKEIDTIANQLLSNPEKIKRLDIDAAKKQGLVLEKDLISPYVAELDKVVKIDRIKSQAFAATPLGGSANGYYEAINAHYGTSIKVALPAPDPASAHRTYDWDGKLRGDPSSEYVMKAVAGMRQQLGVAFIGANDNDADRFGGEDSTGILNPNHILCVLFDYLAKDRNFDSKMGIGRTIGTTHLLDRLAQKYKRPCFEVNVGFKYYVQGLIDHKYILAGEESAGLSLPRLNGQVWVTEKDGIAALLLMMEAMAHSGKNMGELYRDLTAEFGEYQYDRVDTAATPAKRSRLQALAADPEKTKALLAGKKIAGREIERLVIGDGIKVVLDGDLWVLKRASGTEDIIKDYMEEKGESLANARKASAEIDHLLGLE